MNDFAWRKTARRIAKFELSGIIFYGIVFAFILVEELGICSLLFDKDVPPDHLCKTIQELYRDLKFTPSSLKVYMFLFRFSLSFICHIRATRDLFEGTRLVTDTEGISKAVKHCKSWQTIHVGFFFLKLVKDVPYFLKKWLSDNLNSAGDLKYFVFNVSLMIWFYTIVGQYIRELQTELRRRR